MNKVLITIAVLLCLNTHGVSQHEGNQWVFGYWSGGSTDYSVMTFDFGSGNLKLDWDPSLIIYINETQGNICTKEGEALVWTNGMEIMGKHGFEISDTIAYDGPSDISYWDYFYYQPHQRPFGFPKHDGAIILPFSRIENEYSVIYHSAGLHSGYYYQVNRLLEARIRYNHDESFTLLFQDSLLSPPHEWFTGPIKAVRHANGRDWWVVAFEENTGGYFSYLLDPQGIRLDHIGSVDSIVLEGLGHAAFSSQGNFLARADAISAEVGQFITLYSFDRCSGDLVRMNSFHTPTGFFTGVAFSPSERYLYGDNNNYLWQWDLWADDIAASQTLVDTFDGFVQPGWTVMRFGPMMTAPDGRVYVVPPAGSSEFIHVIDRPDLPASDVRFLQHHINLTKPNGRTAPNLPNFRLGPLDGSPCDTLGLNNIPVSWWRYEEDQPGDWYNIRFTDLSYFNPETWHWDFDDGSTSDERSPVHTFESGLYKVCLTVANENDSDSLCQWIEILTTGIEEENNNALSDLSISPNPFQEDLKINSASGEFRNARIQLHDIHGRLVFDQPDVPIPISIRLTSLLPGMYLCSIREQDGSVHTFKVMKN